MKKPTIKRYNRASVFTEIPPHNPNTSSSSYVEVTEWHNGEGLDIEVVDSTVERFQLTWEQFKAVKKLVKELLNKV